MLRLASDLARADGRDGATAGWPASRCDWDPRAAVCVVLAAEGYPGNYERGKVISGLDALRGWRDGMVFHAGTQRRDGAVVTNGGRVLGVTALGDDVAAAVAEAYRAVDADRVGRHALPARHRPARHGARAMTTAAQPRVGRADGQRQRLGGDVGRGRSGWRHSASPARCT